MGRLALRAAALGLFGILAIFATPALAVDVPIIANVTALRALPAGFGGTTSTVYLESYGGTPSLAGAGTLTYDAGSSAADNGCTVFQQTAVTGAGRWVRPLPDGVLQAGYCGVEANGVANDTAAWNRALALFTSGRRDIMAGHINFCGVSLFNAPLIYGGGPGTNLLWTGCQGESRGNVSAALKWTGTGFRSAVIFYGANKSKFLNVNLDCTAAASVGLVNCLHMVSDNPVSADLAGSLSPGTSVSVALTNVTNIAVGSAIGIGNGSTGYPPTATYPPSPFEVAYVTAISGTTVTLDRIQFSHASGEKVGGSAGSSGSGVENASIVVPYGADTTLGAGLSAGSSVTATVASTANMAPGVPLYVGGNSTLAWEVVYPTAITSGTTFVANFIYPHSTGEIVATTSAGIYVGNVTSAGTPQVSETNMRNINCNGQSDGVHSAYTCFRYITSGNVKNHTLDTLTVSAPRIMAAFENASGYVRISNVAGNSTLSDFWLAGAALYKLSSIEVEDVIPGTNARFIMGQGVSSFASTLTVENCQWQGFAPSDDYIIRSFSNMQLIGNQFINLRDTVNKSLPLIQYAAPYTPGVLRAAAITSIGNFYQYASNLTPIFYDGSNNAWSWSQYPISLGYLPNLVSIGDYGTYGNLQYMAGQWSVMSSGPTIDGLGLPIPPSSSSPFGNIGQVSRNVSYVTLPYTAFTGGTAVNLKAFGIPPNQQITRVVAKVATPFTGTGGTVMLRAGTTSGAQDLLKDFDVKTAPIISGLAPADLGTCLSGAVQGGCFPTGLAAANLWLGMTSSSGALSGLTAGSVTLSLTLEKVLP